MLLYKIFILNIMFTYAGIMSPKIRFMMELHGYLSTWVHSYQLIPPVF
jgi:hypothetical protein